MVPNVGYFPSWQKPRHDARYGLADGGGFKAARSGPIQSNSGRKILVRDWPCADLASQPHFSRGYLACATISQPSTHLYAWTHSFSSRERDTPHGYITIRSCAAPASQSLASMLISGYQLLRNYADTRISVLKSLAYD
jgi:hypothetical protein